MAKEETCYIEGCRRIAEDKCEDCGILICRRHKRVYSERNIWMPDREFILCPLCLEKRHETKMKKMELRARRKNIKVDWKPRTKKPWWFPI